MPMKPEAFWFLQARNLQQEMTHTDIYHYYLKKRKAKRETETVINESHNLLVNDQRESAYEEYIH